VALMLCCCSHLFGPLVSPVLENNSNAPRDDAIHTDDAIGSGVAAPQCGQSGLFESILGQMRYICMLFRCGFLFTLALRETQILFTRNA
jgi:hypothetical protein